MHNTARARESARRAAIYLRVFSEQMYPGYECVVRFSEAISPLIGKVRAVTRFKREMFLSDKPCLTRWLLAVTI